MRVTDELDNRLEWAHATGNSRAAAVVLDEHGPVYGEVEVLHDEPERFLGGQPARGQMFSWRAQAEIPLERASAIYGAGEVRTVRFGPRVAQLNYEGSAYATGMEVRDETGRQAVAVVTFVGSGPITHEAIDAPNDAT